MCVVFLHLMANTGTLTFNVQSRKSVSFILSTVSYHPMVDTWRHGCHNWHNPAQGKSVITIAFELARKKVKVKVRVYSLVRIMLKLTSPDFAIITPLIIGNDPTLTYLSFWVSQPRAHCKVTFPLSYPLLLGRQRHLWRCKFSEHCRSPMKSLKLAQYRDWAHDLLTTRTTP